MDTLHKKIPGRNLKIAPVNNFKFSGKHKVPGKNISLVSQPELENIDVGPEIDDDKPLKIDHFNEKLRKYSLRFGSTKASQTKDYRAYRGLWKLNKQNKNEFIKFWSSMGYSYVNCLFTANYNHTMSITCDNSSDNEIDTSSNKQNNEFQQIKDLQLWPERGTKIFSHDLQMISASVYRGKVNLTLVRPRKGLTPKFRSVQMWSVEGDILRCKFVCSSGKEGCYTFSRVL